jgi:dethiobiotin synthetase
MFLKKVARMDESINHITPCCFETPVSPLTASEMEGGEVDVKMIKEELNLLLESYQTVVVEGIGGLLVPIMKDYFVIDLIKELALPLIIVASPSLGTISHTLLSVRYAVQEGIAVSGIIINFSKPSDGTVAEQTNPAVLQKLISAPLIGIFPHLKNLTDEVLEKTASRHLDIETLLKV